MWLLVLLYEMVQSTMFSRSVSQSCGSLVESFDLSYGRSVGRSVEAVKFALLGAYVIGTSVTDEIQCHHCPLRVSVLVATCILTDRTPTLT